MKGTERHRLKENELSHVLAGATASMRDHGRSVSLAVSIVGLVLIAAGGYWAWKTRTESRAQILLGDAVIVAQAPIQEPKAGVTPAAGSYPTIAARAEAAVLKLAAVYDAYPSTKAGIAARYHAAAALALLGRPADAVTRYQEVIDRAGSGDFYGRMARLGIVEANAQAKQFDKAISAAEALVKNTSEDVIPRDALLMELGRVQAAAGKKAEAKQTLDKVIAEFPQSAYIEEAKQLLASLT
ncbi:MAG TPA: tetratricopeptide repeat protein [Vicinamibacterales bacterium]|nr:tetratricopeptide repeat protein [Vicinamibacterales bacterium]